MTMPRHAFTVGLISDTHGLLRPEALELLRGSDHIIHAGDVGAPPILAELSRLAPVTAVRGNIDTADWARVLPHSSVLTLGGFAILTIHDVAELGPDPAPAGIRVVVAGHSHKPRIERRGAVLFVNPGSAGRRRFSLPTSAGRLRVTADAVTAELFELQPGFPLLISG